MQEITPFYTAEATNTGGRNGRVKSSDGVLDMDVKPPTQLGGAVDGFTNPEQLFAAGWSACYGSALAAVGKDLNVKDAQVTVRVSIGKTEAGGFGLAAELRVHLPHLMPEEAQAVADKAHAVCPYSVATRGNIPVNLVVV
jgi:Ohr subfamily peroxiredoxin